jgi:lysophospholipase L1-like esterase
MNKKKLMFLTIGLIVLVVLSGVALFFMLSVGSRDFSEDKIRVACVGDSITEGTDYPDELWMLLGANYTVGNYGVGGSAVSLDSGKPYMNESAFEEAKEFQPNIVIIMLGTNDANSLISSNNGRFVNDYIKLVAEFQALSTKPKIYLVKPPPVFSDGTVPNAEYFSSHVIPNIEKVANQINLPIINVYSALVNHSEFFPDDGVHPDIEGAKLIAYEIYKAITLQSAP